MNCKISSLRQAMFGFNHITKSMVNSWVASQTDAAELHALVTVNCMGGYQCGRCHYTAVSSGLSINIACTNPAFGCYTK